MHQKDRDAVAGVCSICDVSLSLPVPWGYGPPTDEQQQDDDGMACSLAEKPADAGPRDSHWLTALQGQPGRTREHRESADQEKSKAEC